MCSLDDAPGTRLFALCSNHKVQGLLKVLFPLYCRLYLTISKQIKDLNVVFSNQTEQEKSS